MNCWRFSITTFVYFPLAWFGVLNGGYWALICLLAVLVIQLIVDHGVARSPPGGNASAFHPASCRFLLYLHLPHTLILLLLLAWQVAPGDLWQLGQMMSERIQLSHRSTSFFEILTCALLAGYLLSANTIVAHELVHHPQSRFGSWLARLLLIINCDSQFTISHVYGHHRQVGTPADPATARRGENLYAFAVRSALGQYAQAFAIRNNQLARKGERFFSPHNELLRGIAASMIAITVVAVALHYTVLVALLTAIAFSKFLFEAANYIQHYGIVRVPGTAVADRHSWDCHREGTTWVHYALTRHVHHHRQPNVPFWQLTTTAQPVAANHLSRGYLAAIAAAMIPPLWFRIVRPVVSAWDADEASADERQLITKVANPAAVKSLGPPVTHQSYAKHVADPGPTRG